MLNDLGITRTESHESRTQGMEFVLSESCSVSEGLPDVFLFKFREII